MLKTIGSVERISEFVAKAKDRDDPFRLMGFGHRVYKNFDPRATIMRETCHEVLDELGKKDEPLLKLAMELERVALQDPYFVERKLYPNVDFYSGIIFKAIGIPRNNVHGAFCCCTYRRVGCPVERNDRGPQSENWQTASTLHRTRPARLPPPRDALGQSGTKPFITACWSSGTRSDVVLHSSPLPCGFSGNRVRKQQDSGCIAGQAPP